MATRDIAAEILDVKGRGHHRSGTDSLFRSFRNEWNDLPTQVSSLIDFFLMRAVTLLEVFTREWIATLIDQGAPYNERAINVARNIKIDFPLSKEAIAKDATDMDCVSRCSEQV